MFYLNLVIGLVFAVFLYPYFRLLVKAFILKLTYGDEIAIRIHPLQGIVYYNNFSVKKYKDSLKWIVYLQNKNPNLKAIISNLGTNIQWILLNNSLIIDVYQTQHDKFLKIQPIYAEEMMIEQGISGTTSQSQWKRQKNLLGKFFLYTSMRDKFEIMKNKGREIVDIINHKLNGKYTEIALKNPLKDIISKMMLVGFYGNYYDDVFVKGRHFSECLSSLLKVSLNATLTTYFRLKTAILGKQARYWFPSKLEKETLALINDVKQVFSQQIENRLASKEEKNDILQLMINDYRLHGDQPGQTNKEEIVQQLITLGFAGTDSNTNLAVKVIYLFLSCCASKSGRRSIEYCVWSDINEMKFEDLKLFKYTKAYYKEVQRFEAAFPLTVTLQKTKIADRFVFQKGDITAPCLHAVHRNKQNFENPDEFVVERWLDEDKNIVQYLKTFLNGPRACIGSNVADITIMLLLIYIVKNYTVVAERAADEVLLMTFVYGPQKDQIFRFIPRNIEVQQAV